MFASKDTLLTRPSGGYNIARSVRLRSSASAYFNRTFASTPTSWTASFWVKRGTLGATQQILASRLSGTGAAFIQFNSSDQLSVANNATSVTTNAVYRDPSAWYHFVVSWTSGNVVTIYCNNVSQSVTGSITGASQLFTSTWTNTIGRYGDSASGYLDGYLTEINFIDGQALTPSSFGTTNSITGVWQPAKYTGTYGTNGFYLNFSSNGTAAALGTDFSGNSNTWTVNNISVTAGSTYDSMTDVPTLTSATAANYAVLNPLVAGTASYLSGGNLNASISATNTNVLGTMQLPTSGKFYWEYQITTIGGGGAPMGGIASTTSSSPALFYRSNGDKLVDGTGSAYGATYTTTDTIGVAVDVDGGTVTFYKNNSSQGAITYAGGSFYPALRSNAATDVFNINFGQRPFSYTPPTGYVALNTYNLPTSTITNGAAYMAATTYTGNSSTLTVTNTVGSTSFKPDFVWIKDRSTTSQHVLTDSVRGVDRQLFSSLTNAEQTSATGITSFNSNGFTTGANPSPTGATNSSPDGFIAWQWQAGAGSSSSNTNGSITSTVSAGATQGFSVATFSNPTSGTSFTVGHGLGVAPAMIIFKYRNTTSDWYVYHQKTGNTGLLFLDTTGAFQVNSTFLNNTSPTSSVFTIGSSFITATVYNFVAYCFAEVAGYSAFGSYTGNGSTDGPFVYTGFRPRWLLWKNTSLGGTDWTIVDSSRNTYNVANSGLQPNGSYAEASNSNYQFDFLSNGFKVRTTNPEANRSGDTIIYACFAENPFRNALAR